MTRPLQETLDAMARAVEPIFWSELAALNHETQVEQFGFCACEDTEIHEHPYDDCPKGWT